MATTCWKREVPFELHGNGRFVLARDKFAPAYLKTYEEGRLKEKAQEAIELLRSCTLCPRDCRVNRLEDKKAACRSGRLAKIASAFSHFGEEDCLRGTKGSGTIFFSWCNLRCVFCQNFESSQLGEGIEVTPHELAAIMLRLQEAGCHNINLVTPEHVVAQILEALPIAIERGLRLPLVYNTGGYDSDDSIRLMDGVADIYMPDFKMWDEQLSLTYLRARDYPEAARRAIKAMHNQVGELQVDSDGVALRGVLVRHLVMPGMLEDTAQIMAYLANELSTGTYVNIMDQYRPAYKAINDEKYSLISRGITKGEIAQAEQVARAFGLWRFDVRWQFVMPRYSYFWSPQVNAGL